MLYSLDSRPYTHPTFDTPLVAGEYKDNGKKKCIHSNDHKHDKLTWHVSEHNILCANFNVAAKFLLRAHTYNLQHGLRNTEVCLEKRKNYPSGQFRSNPESPTGYRYLRITGT
uniref:Uncharacterized protein n=1 Tax=Cacopsylla melanoneura TaxID=428564 RepID=A0A8D9EV02_9HEMI